MSSRQERQAVAHEKNRTTRREARERYQRQQRTKRIAIGAVVLVALAGVGWLGYTIYQDQEDQQLLGDVASFDVVAGHIEDPVTYEQTPPAGGQHSATWQNCGYYSAPVRNENAVHALEHGAVWITYRPDLPADQIQNLRERTEGTSYILTSPYPDLPAPVVASAWGRQLTFESATDEALSAFLREYRQWPNAPEPGASCSGGTSATQ